MRRIVKFGRSFQHLLPAAYWTGISGCVHSIPSGKKTTFQHSDVYLLYNNHHEASRILTKGDTLEPLTDLCGASSIMCKTSNASNFCQRIIPWSINRRFGIFHSVSFYCYQVDYSKILLQNWVEGFGQVSARRQYFKAPFFWRDHIVTLKHLISRWHWDLRSNCLCSLEWLFVFSSHPFISATPHFWVWISKLILTLVGSPSFPEVRVHRSGVHCPARRRGNGTIYGSLSPLLRP